MYDIIINGHKKYAKKMLYSSKEKKRNMNLFNQIYALKCAKKVE